MKNILVKKLIYELVAVAVGVITALIPPPAGLTPQSMWTLGILLWAIVNWIFKPIPDISSIIIMLAAWAVLKILPFSSAFAPFAGSTFWLFVGVFAISASVSKSGLLKRMALLIMRLFPPTFRGQVLALLGCGLIIGPLIPSTSAKISIASPLAAGIGETMALPPKSKGLSGIFLAMYTGFSMLAPAFVSSSFFAYMIIALMPDAVQAQFTWGYWVLFMLVWTIITTAGSYFAITKLYAPKDAAPMTKDTVRRQLEALGPMSRDEKITLAILLLCILFWILEAFTGIASVIPALFGAAILFALGVLEVPDFSNRLPWHFLIFSGGVMGIANALSTVGVTDWIGTVIKPFMGVLTVNPYVFVIAGSLLFFLMRFILVDHMSAFTLFTMIVIPFCVAAGINPMIGGIVSYVNVMPFVLYYQNVQFVLAYESFGGEKKLVYNKLAPYYFVFLGICIMGLVLSVPYWTALGLIK